MKEIGTISLERMNNGALRTRLPNWVTRTMFRPITTMNVQASFKRLVINNESPFQNQGRAFVILA